MRVVLIILLLGSLCPNLMSQAPQPAFVMPAQACLGENIKFTNQSTGADRYEWDVCQGDLQQTPTAQILANIGGNVTTGIDMVFDGTNWFGFVANQNGSSILRLDFGNDVQSVPAVTNLGNISGIMNNPTDIKIVNDNGNWYGFVYGLSDPLISRINFGSSLTNTPTSPESITADIILSGSGSVNAGLDVMHDGSNWNIILTYFSSFTIIRLPAISGTPAPTDILASIPNPFGSIHGDVVLVKHNSTFFGYVVAYGNRSLQRLSFGSTLFATPVIENIPVAALSAFTPYGVDIGMDEGRYYLFISTNEGSLIKVDLGKNLVLAEASGVSLGNFGVLENTLKFKLINDKSRWFGFSPAWASSVLLRINFPTPSCEFSQAIVTNESPVINFNSVGDKTITLRAIKNNRPPSDLSKSLTVIATPAPDLDFTFNTFCLTSPIQFTTQSSATLVTFNWFFGDGQSSPDENPVYQYGAVGDYLISLSAEADNGCTNYVEKSTSIFNEPIADFTVPLATPYCTNQQYTFENTTLADAGYSVSWQWSVNSVPQATDEDFNYSFTQTTNQDITLTASIPGCSNSITKSINSLTEGPVTDFTFSGQCINEQVVFTNTSAGAIVGFLWDFDDGQTSTDTDPAYLFATPGQYSVSLTAISGGGCNNSVTKPVTVYTAPQVNFASALPPFSCTGTPTMFNDLTPNPTDSNLATWLWNFGDPGSGNNTSTLRNPQHVYATANVYPVTLTVATNFGCTSSLQLPITIYETPPVDFSSTPTCEDVAVTFSGMSSPGTLSWNWQIGSSFYSSEQPTHTFTNPGDYSALLTITGANGCIASTSKPVHVPAKLNPDFTFQKNCVGQLTEFTDVTSDGADPITNRQWNFHNLGSGTGSPATFTFTTTGNKNVFLNLTTQSGCSYSQTKVVSVGNSPLASFSASPEIGAAPLIIQFTNTSTDATQFFWEFDDALNSTSTLTSPQFTFSQLGEYTVKLTASNSQNCATLFSRLIQVVIPNIQISLSGLELMEVAGGKKPAVTIINSSNIPVSNVNLLLDVSGPVLQEMAPITLAPQSSHRYVLQAVITPSPEVQYVCVEAQVPDNTSNDLRTCLSLEDEFILFAPYPNPVRDEMFVDWILNEDSNVNITLVNGIGQQVKAFHVNAAEGLTPFHIDTTDLQSGPYLVRISRGNFVRVFRVFVLE